MPEWPLGGGGGPTRPRPNGPRLTMPELPRKVVIGLGAAGVGLILILVIFLTGRGGIVEVADTEVAVIVNYLNGEKTLVVTPGYKIFIPVMAQAFKFDKSPNKYVMEGERDRGWNRAGDAYTARKLTVRANDGSNFWFETLEIQYQLIEEMAPMVLDDSGPGDAFKRNWIRAYARSVLRDEFGRFSAEEVADPTNYKAATERAQERLDELLASHGIRIIQIITPKPKFEPSYEQAINDRKVADQEVEKLKAKAEQLLQERARRLADIERDQATRYEELLGDLEAKRVEAEREQVRLEREADAYRIERVAAGQAMEDQLLQQARALEEQARKAAEGLRAKVEALARRGDILVREVLAARLAEIPFRILPYRRDPTPLRIEHLGAAVLPGGGER